MFVSLSTGVILFGRMTKTQRYFYFRQILREERSRAIGFPFESLLISFWSLGMAAWVEQGLRSPHSRVLPRECGPHPTEVQRRENRREFTKPLPSCSTLHSYPSIQYQRKNPSIQTHHKIFRLIFTPFQLFFFFLILKRRIIKKAKLPNYPEFVKIMKLKISSIFNLQKQVPSFTLSDNHPQHHHSFVNFRNHRSRRPTRIYCNSDDDSIKKQPTRIQLYSKIESL